MASTFARPHSGAPGRRARELCPDLVFVGGHFKEYQRLGNAAVSVLGDFTPLVERISPGLEACKSEPRLIEIMQRMPVL